MTIANAPYVRYSPATKSAIATLQGCHSKRPNPHAAVRAGNTPAEPNPNSVSVHPVTIRSRFGRRERA
jgi:hypothetical protein